MDTDKNGVQNSIAGTAPLRSRLCSGHGEFVGGYRFRAELCKVALFQFSSDQFRVEVGRIVTEELTRASGNGRAFAGNRMK
jgi:hypothetical protein